jgi:archaellum component FlaD/FlaE
MRAARYARVREELKAARAEFEIERKRRAELLPDIPEDIRAEMEAFKWELFKIERGLRDRYD